MKSIFFTLLIISFSFLSAQFSHIDKLFNDGSYEEALSACESIYSSNLKNSDFLWRYTRAYFELSDQESDANKKKYFINKAFPIISDALKIDSLSSKTNHWYAVIIGKKGELEGTKQKILNSYQVREYGEKAIKLNPNYDGTQHLMGRWHYELASLSWFEKSIASLIYETPPNGDYYKAIDFFSTAHQLNPEDIRHLLWLGKTYIATNEKSKARDVLYQTISLVPFDNSDKMMQEEAAKLLSKLK